MHVNLLAAATAYVAESDARTREATGAARVWAALTGLTGTEAAQAARDLIAADDVMGPVHLLIGVMPACEHNPDGDLLVTVWADGTGEVAWRPAEGGRWGAPSPLAPAP